MQKAARAPKAAGTDKVDRADPTDARPIDYGASPFGIIESVLSPSGAPVLGLHLHVAYMAMLDGFQKQLGMHQVTPNGIGIIALVERHPGISQIALAKLIRLERASVGDRVARSIAAGLMRRVDSPDDRRKYALFLTARGRRVLQQLRERIPAHEDRFAAGLTREERLTLRRLLDKLVPDWNGANP